MITKMEIRAVVLAHLQLRPGLIMWDLGAGSGSVSIEAARLAPLQQVIAVEKNRGRFEALRQNVKNLGGPEAQVVFGSAGDVIDQHGYFGGPHEGDGAGYSVISAAKTLISSPLTKAEPSE